MTILKIYNAQDALADMYDLEIKYIDNRPRSDKDSWLPVADLDGHVFSAFFDTRPEVIAQYTHESNATVWSIVRIIAILPTTIQESSIQCVYKYPHENFDGQSTRRHATSVKAIENNWSLKYSAFFVLCDLAVPKNLNSDNVLHVDPLPVSVAIGLVGTKQLQFIDIHYPTMGLRQLAEPYIFMAVCVPGTCTTSHILHKKVRAIVKKVREITQSQSFVSLSIFLTVVKRKEKCLRKMY